MTVAERIATVAAASGVIAAFQEGNAKSIGPLSLVPVAWVHVSGAIARRGGGNLIVSNYQGEGETAYWGSELPSVLVPAPSAPGYITDRNTPFTDAQVKSFVNTTWRAHGAAYTNAPDVLGMEIDNQNGKAVLVRGLFWMEDGTRSDRKYIIRFVDANGSTTGDNVKFERIQ